jgi:hypothetical protein
MTGRDFLKRADSAAQVAGGERDRLLAVMVVTGALILALGVVYRVNRPVEYVWAYAPECGEQSGGAGEQGGGGE